MLKGKTRQVLKNSELRFYFFIIVVATTIITSTIIDSNYHLTTGDEAPHGFFQAFTDSLFQVLSIVTTTGFATVNFEEWGIIAKATLVVLMITGGSGGSTAGGIKLIRILTTLKMLSLELERSFRPNVIRPIKIGTHSVDESERTTVLAYVIGILLLFVIGASLLLLTEENISAITALTASLASVNNIGPGFEKVGAIENYGWFSDAGKAIICILMPIGRLEVFAVLVIFMPKFWKID